MLLLDYHVCVLTLTLVVACACRSAPVPASHDPLGDHAAWANTPLNPSVQFFESVAPRTVVVLVLDAHSGTPLDAARAILGPADVVADQFGRARIRRVALGRQLLRVLRPGYQVWSDSVAISDTTGLAVVVQLRRSSATFYDPAVGTKPP